MPKEMVDLISQWHGWGMRDRGKMFRGCLFHGVIWGIWKEGCSNFLR